MLTFDQILNAGNVLSVIGVAICGGLFHLVWLISGMKTELVGMRSDMKKLLERQEALEKKVEQHNIRLVRIEDRVKLSTES